jgi:cell division inhibitor SulA
MEGVAAEQLLAYRLIAENLEAVEKVTVVGWLVELTSEAVVEVQRRAIL